MHPEKTEAIRLRMGALLALAGLASCGSGAKQATQIDGAIADSGPQEPPPFTPVEGGGTAGPPLAGALHIMVVERFGGAPIPGAAVQIGEVAVSGRTGTTDADGRLTLLAADLAGPELVAVGKPGYRTAVFTDVDASSISVPLRPLDDAPVPTGTISGTVDFRGLPRLPSGHVQAAMVLYGTGADPEDPRNLVPQATGRAGGPANVYFPDVGPWSVTAPAGRVDLCAVAVDVNRDDLSVKSTFLGFLDGVTVAKGDQIQGQVITPTVPLDQNLAIHVPDGTAGMTQRSILATLVRPSGEWIVGIANTEVGSDGNVVIPAPKLEGVLAGATLSVDLVATNGAADYTAPITRQSTTTLAGIADPATPPPPGEFLPPIGDLAFWAPRGLGPFQTVAGASLYRFEIAPRRASPTWEVWVLDPSRHGTALPEVGADPGFEPLPAGDLDLEGYAAVVPSWDPRMARLRAAVSPARISLSVARGRN